MSKTLVIFTYANAGLGHLRVARALYRGMPAEVDHEFLVLKDASVTYLHRIMSVHRLGRAFTEWMQHGLPEAIFTKYYRRVLRQKTGDFYAEFSRVLKQYPEAKNVVVVSTHFGLGHKLEAIRARLTSEHGISLKHAVVVTDDSPQKVWYVRGADLTFVCSELTKEALSKYAASNGDKQAQFVVNPYPIDGYLASSLSENQLAQRIAQLSSEKSDVPIHMCVPISGAAVSVVDTYNFIENLDKVEPRFRFHVISKEVPFTYEFLENVRTLPNVFVRSSNIESEVVDIYEQLFEQGILSFELTKPSEQAFKALVTPSQAGGVVLLFTEPVGRQEKDNLDFMLRHYLIPSNEVSAKLWDMARAGTDMEENSTLLADACTWRGLLLPNNPLEASNFVNWALKNRVFASMFTCKVAPSHIDPHPDEVNGDGVGRFWRVLEIAS